jgi:Family of unknown function (DUF6535)
MLQQWARRYLTVTQPPRWSPHKQARIRSFFADGVEKFRLPLMVETLPTLLHLSLFLFFSGLLVFLFNINHTTFKAIAWWVGLFGWLYGCITLLPIFRHDSPYYTPLSSSAWFLLNGVLYNVFRILTFFTWSRSRKMWATYRERTSWGIMGTAQATVLKMSAKIDWHILKWTIDALDEDRKLEQFFEGIPAFCTSQVVHEPRQMLTKLYIRDFELTSACIQFLIRTCSSRFLSERIKERRFILCTQVIDTLDSSSFPSYGLLSQVFGPPAMDGVLKSIQMGHFLRSRCHSIKDESTVYTETLVGGIIANVPERDDRWKALVMAQLRISEDVFQHYLAHGGSVLLANWIHIASRLFRVNRERPLIPELLMNILSIPSTFDIRDTLPELRHDFCALWNKFAREAHKSGSSYMIHSFLKPNRHHYIALHQGTDSAPTAFDASTNDPDSILYDSFSYPLCNIPGHHSGGATDDTTHSLISVHPPDADLTTITPAAPGVSFFPAITPDHSRIHLTEQSSPHGVPHATPTIQPSHLSPPLLPEPALTTVTESLANLPVISPTDNPNSDSRPVMVAEQLVGTTPTVDVDRPQ